MINPAPTPTYGTPKIKIEGSLPQFPYIRVGPSCSGGCSRHMPEI
jgi:hypothetical protein